MALLRTLAGLRYRLLWAHARTSKGKIALFLALYAIGGLLALFFALGGLGVAIAAVKMGRGEVLARAVFGAILLNGVLLSLTLGMGPRPAFADRVLRRYPLTGVQRFAARHLVGILDPAWPLLGTIALGFALGLAALGACPVVVAIAGVLLFIAVAYLLAAVVLTFIDRVMEFRGGGTALSVAFQVLIVMVSFLPLAMQSRSRGWVRALVRALDFTPAASASVMLADPRWLFRASAAVMLAGWGAALWFALRLLEKWQIQRRHGGDEPISLDTGYERAARGAGPKLAPLVANALRYTLRCNRARYQLAMAVPMVLFMEFVFGRFNGIRGNGVPALAWIFMAGIFSTLAVSVNLFGYDAAGMRRYPLLPVSLAATLRAKSRASMLLASCVLAPAIVLWCILHRDVIGLRGVFFVLCDAFGGLFLLQAAGLWASVLTPKRGDFNRVMGNDMSAGGKIIMVISVMIFSAAGPLGQKVSLARVLAYWWVMAAVAVVSAAIYYASLALAGRVLESRRERMIDIVAGASGN